MGTSILETKFLFPATKKEWLARRRLLDLLENQVEKRLSLVVAPAGYGKTTLLASFAAGTAYPVTWLSLDMLDRDPRRFLAHFIAGLTRTFPSISGDVMSSAFPVGQTGIDIDRITTLLVNEIHTNIEEHFVYILDDLQFVEDTPLIIQFVNNFVRSVGENCHLVLASRYLPSLPDMPALVAGMDVGGISLEELAFQPDEIQSLVEIVSGNQISVEAAGYLADESEGWITGLLLSGLGAIHRNADQLRLARVSGVGLYDYLASEILDQQPESVRKFLLETALLGDFNAELWQAVIGGKDNWEKLIRVVLDKNLFIQAVGGRSAWYRYHHLFQVFLQETISRENPAQYQSISENLAAHHASHQDWDLALAVYERLGNHQATADLILEASQELTSSGRTLLVNDWLSRLPPAIIEARPEIWSLQGILHVMFGDVDSGAKLLDRAVRHYRDLGDEHGLLLSFSRRMFAQNYRGDYITVVRNAEEAVSLRAWENIHPLIRGDILRAQGHALARLDRIEDALVSLTKALGNYEGSQNPGRVAITFIDLGFAKRLTGQYRQAREYYERSLRHSRGRGDLINQATLLNNIGVISHAIGDFLEASQYFEQALDCAKRSGFHRAEAMTLASMGDMYGDLDDFEAALDAYHLSRSVAYRGRYESLLLYLDLAEAIIAHRKGDQTLAKYLLSLAEKRLGEIQSDYERGLYYLRAGQLSIWDGDYWKAIADLDQAAGLFSSTGRPQELSEVYLVIAEARAQLGNTADAISALEIALEQADKMDSSHHLVRQGRFLGALLALAESSNNERDGTGLFLVRVHEYLDNLPKLRQKLRKRTTFIEISPSPLRILAFGEPQVTIKGHSIGRAEWKTNTARDLFYCLLANPGGMTRDALGEILWPGKPAKKIKVNFKNTLYRLRLALGSEAIQFEMDRYWFNSHQDYWYDVDEFTSSVEKAKQAIGNEKKINLYQSAIENYRGVYLDGVDRPWVPVDRERYHKMYLTAGEALATLHKSQEDWAECLAICERILLLDPSYEPIYRFAMEAESGLGNQAGVVSYYNQCRAALMEDLEVTPSEQTQQVYRRLIQ